MKRIQSPSSINTYLQCPRKYYFIYQLKLPTKPSIHLVRGSVAHEALEHFYGIDPNAVGAEFRDELHVQLLRLLRRFWEESKGKFDKLDMPEGEIEGFYHETQMMMVNWGNQFCDKIEKMMGQGMTFPTAFAKLKPKTEVLYLDNELQVRGYIDAIEEVDGKIRLMDYKTSKKADINDAYRLQLAIYALLYEKKHGKRADNVGIYFLKENEQVLSVDDELVKHAKFMIEQVHASTDGLEDIEDYPKKTSPLCKWSTGQCDFYAYCFEGKVIPKQSKLKDFS